MWGLALLLSVSCVVCVEFVLIMTYCSVVSVVLSVAGFKCGSCVEHGRL